MKHTVLLAAWLLPLGSQAGELMLEFHGKDMSGYTLMVEVFNSENKFLSDNKRVRAIKVKATSNSATVLIHDLISGNYAVAAFVDRNQNGNLDRNFVGLPTELYGFSREARRLFGPPSFDEAKFDLGDDTVSQSIHLH